MSTPVNLADALGRIPDYWNPRIVGELNGQHVKLARIKGEFEWHHHRHEDELFLVLRGRLDMHLRDRVVAIHEGEMFIVPRGVEHKPVAREETHILLFEPVGTVNTGDVRSARTRDTLENLTEIRPGPAGQPAFQRYIGIDYSGARTPDASLKGLRVFEAMRDGMMREVPRPRTNQPALNPKIYWTRKDLAEWLIDELRDGPPTIVGIDHAFSFPLKYFKKHRLSGNWDEFLEDFHRHWPTDQDHTYVDFVFDGRRGSGAERTGSAKWRRLTEERCRAKSVFHWRVPGSVAHSTHAGLPWLLHMRRALGERVHVWPFDGWEIPRGKSAVVEIYPSLWSRKTPRGDRTPDQHDAFVTAAWLRDSDSNGWLTGCQSPSLTPSEREQAAVEGWILGVG